jgi:hypothetical protein
MPSSSSSSDRGIPMPRSYRNHLPAPYWENMETHVCPRCTPGHPDLRRRQEVRDFDRLRGPFLDYAVFLMEVRGWTLTDAVSTAIMTQRSVRRQGREEERALRVRLRRPQTPPVVRDLPTLEDPSTLVQRMLASIPDWTFGAPQ